MNCPRSFRLATVALVPIAVISLSFGSALAQSPTAPPAASGPATPAPAPTATPAPPPAETKSPADMPSAAQTPATPPAAPVQTADPFGEQITLEPKTVIIARGNANWDSAFDTLIDSFKSLSTLLATQPTNPSHNPIHTYT